MWIWTSSFPPSSEALERVDLDIELPTVIRSIGWGRLYDEPFPGSHILTLEFLMPFLTYEHDGNPWVHFHFFGKHINLIFLILVSSWIFLATAFLNSKP
jgi:hypothetical protein